MTRSRREFMKFLGAGAMVAPLAGVYARAAHGMPAFGPGFGPLAPVLPLNTAELAVPGAFDLRNIALLELPRGFSYRAVSCTGQRMSDGSLVPGDHDGMAAFAGRDGTTVLVRNHELSNREAKFGNALGVQVPDALKWDTFANGGTTTLVVDARGRLVRDHASLGGTNNNCAGGLTPWGTWLTCEESFVTPENTPQSPYQRRHGYVFEVPALATAPVAARPITAMGRFNHEATATDPRTGIVYLSEDRADGCLYRFVPHHAGHLAAGGTLQALKLAGGGSVNTATGLRAELNRPLPVEWVTIEDVDPVGDTVRVEARSKGAARFARGEGLWHGNGAVYLVCTSGGDAGAGQVFAHDPLRGTLTLVVESTDRAVLDAPDNLTVGPDGRLYLCEDGSEGNSIVGVNPDGALFLAARNAFNTSEFCGACFSHDGRFMFVNVQSPGLTLVIEGPWRKGAA
ncbi:MAG TPA: alkaline phosphatase PhoX [Gemmatimonadales bacterium]|nr:alkaline phosphatase PhoX [Gemmatimonadales bacterium]